MNSAQSLQIGSGASVVFSGSGSMSSAGSVQVGSGASLTVNGLINSASSLQLSGGATLTGSGSVGNVTVASGGIVSAGQNGAGTLGLNSLTLGPRRRYGHDQRF